MKKKWIEPLCWAGLAVFTVYLLVVNRDYYRADTQVPTYDEAWYLETSLRLYHRLTHDGLGEFWDAYRRAFGVKAPLISVLPIPFYLVLGTSQYSAMLVNSFFIVLANCYLFLLVRRLFSPDVALAAVVFYQTMPLACGLSRNFMTEYGLAALVILFLYYLVDSERLSHDRTNLVLGTILGLGILMKVLFAAFVAGPLLIAWIRRDRQQPAWRPLAAIGIPAVLIAGSWYAFNLGTLMRFAWQSAYGGIAPEYGAGGFRAWVLLLINQAVSFYYTAAIALFGVAALAFRGASWRALLRDERTQLLLSWVLPPMAALILARNQLIRFVLPILPALAVVLAVAVFHLRLRWMIQAALALLLAVYPQRLFAALSYPSHGNSAGHAVECGPFVVFARDLGWARPPVWEDPWEHRRLLEALRRLAPDTGKPHYVVVGIEHTYLNANLLSYLNAYEEYPLLFTSLGYAESSLDRALERIYGMDAQFLILGEGFERLPEFLNRINHDVQGRITRGDLPFRLRATVPLAHEMKAHIYEREAPWTRFVPGAQVPRPAYPMLVDFPDGVRFLGCDWSARGERLWELTSYWSARDRIGQDYRVNVEFRRGSTPLRSENHFITDGRHPLPEWELGEVVKQSRIIYLEPGGPLEVRLRLTPWGVGPPLEPIATVRLVE